MELSKEVREKEPMTGCRKIHDRIAEKLEEQAAKVGRDKLFSILGEHDMHVKYRKKYTRTTYSNHEYAVAPNRVKEREISAPNEVFVADITYIRLQRGFAYLFLITELYSRKIVGAHLSRSLAHTGAIESLKMALNGVDDASGIIHHSDRGCQYCCHEFLSELSSHGMVPSMTDSNHCYQNAVAERVNGILKQEFYIDATFRSFEQAKFAIEDAVEVYNTLRTHWSLKLKTPEEVYQRAA